MGKPRADDIVAALGLEPHPEGGCYREFFRSGSPVTPRDGRAARAALSAIYYLLRAGETSRWHAVRSDEQWTLLEGDALELSVLDRATFAVTAHRLGAGAPASTRTAVVPGGSWQTARPLGEFALVACTVGPGFDFADFAFLADDPPAAERLRREYPGLAVFL